DPPDHRAREGGHHRVRRRRGLVRCGPTPPPGRAHRPPRPPPRGPRGPGVGQYLLVAALNRRLDPRSKVQIAAWYQRTALRRLLDFRPEQLTSQRFWDQMDRLPPRAILAIERDLTAHLIREFALDVRQVLFDATNFFTFIDTFNER